LDSESVTFSARVNPAKKSLITVKKIFLLAIFTLLKLVLPVIAVGSILPHAGAVRLHLDRSEHGGVLAGRVDSGGEFALRSLFASHVRFQDAWRVPAAVQSREPKREELRERVRRHVLADAGARALARRSRDRARSELARLRTRERMLEADEVSPKLIKRRQRRKGQIELPESAETRCAFRKVMFFFQFARRHHRPVRRIHAKLKEEIYQHVALGDEPAADSAGRLHFGREQLHHAHFTEIHRHARYPKHFLNKKKF
jgi:hypothetical protein